MKDKAITNQIKKIINQYEKTTEAPLAKVSHKINRNHYVNS